MAILITGTSSGIGQSLAEFYCSQNQDVIGLSRTNPHPIDSDHFNFLSCDISNSTELLDVLSAIPENSIDTIILNAAFLAPMGDLQHTSMETIETSMMTNVWSNKVILDHLFTSQKSLKKVIAISSGVTQSVTRGWNAYALSKSTFNTLIKLYAAECPQTHFLLVAPGLVDTKMQDYLCSLPSSELMPSIAWLKDARKGSDMRNVGELLPILTSVIDSSMHWPSGHYIDLYTLQPSVKKVIGYD